METIDHVRLNADGTRLVILDQTQLPNRMEYAELSTAEEMYDAIRKLRVRGAPCIGIFAGFAMYVLANGMKNAPREEFERRFADYSAYLNSSPPRR
jgi:methylthioribose-1-phosphate isomerase